MPGTLSPSRLEAFSDGVIAVIITIMVLEVHVPSTRELSDAAALQVDMKQILIYLLSFVQTGIYWVNHHYLIDDLEQVSHAVLWANLSLLFCMSLIPFGTEWIGVRGVRPIPVALYVLCFLAPAIAWSVLSKVVCGRSGVAPAAGRAKQIFSLVMNVGAIGVAFVWPVVAIGMIAVVAFAWLLPPRRILTDTRMR